MLEVIGLSAVALAVLALAFVLSRRAAAPSPAQFTLDVADRCLTAYEQGLNRVQDRPAANHPDETMVAQLAGLRAPAPAPEAPPVRDPNEYTEIGRNA